VSTSADNRIFVPEGHHSKVGASGITRVIKCAGSNNLSAKLIGEGKNINRSSPAAAEGTAAHLVLSTCLEDGTDAWEMKDIEITVADWTFPVDAEMIEGVQESLDWVRARIAKAMKDGFEVHLYVEKGLTSITDDEVYGTSDIIIHIVGDRLIIVDFKYGRGVSVEPTSDQNAYYGYLSVENYLTEGEEIKVVESWIAQPRIPHPGGTIRRHITNVADLTDWWMNTVIPGIMASRDPDALLSVGEHCRFCNNKGHCPALKREAFNFPVDIDPSFLTDEEVGQLMDRLDAIKTLAPVIEAEAFSRAKSGQRIPGRKVVQKRANRVFKDAMNVKVEGKEEMVKVTLLEALADEFGLDDIYTQPSLKTPPAIEKLDGGKAFAKKWAFKPDTGLTLAPSSDKRSEVVPAIERFRSLRDNENA
jgi:hypothetical protein